MALPRYPSIMATMINAAHLDRLDADKLRELVLSMDSELTLRQIKIDKLTFELAQLRRARFGARTEQFSPEQAELFEETIQTDVAATQAEIEQIAAQPTERAASTPRRKRPANPYCPACDSALH